MQEIKCAGKHVKNGKKDAPDKEAKDEEDQD